MCLCMYECVCAHVCGGQRATPGIFLNFSPSYYSLKKFKLYLFGSVNVYVCVYMCHGVHVNGRG